MSAELRPVLPDDQLRYLWNEAAPEKGRSAIKHARSLLSLIGYDQVVRALAAVTPPNVCTTNQNVSDDVVVPLDFTMGELRRIAAALAIVRAAGGQP